MKKYLVVFLLVIMSFLECNTAIAKVLDKQGHVLNDVVLIFRKFAPLIREQQAKIEEKYHLSKEELEHILLPTTSNEEISIKQLNSIAQIVFLRPSNLERKDLKNYNQRFLPFIDNELVQLFHQIGDLSAYFPTQKEYKYILINGSTITNMRSRIWNLIQLMNQQKVIITKNTEIIFLTGKRDLYSNELEKILKSSRLLKIKAGWQLVSFPTTEDEAAKLIWQQSELPEALKNAKITFAVADKRVEIDRRTGKRTVKRPTTSDTVRAWLEMHPQPGSCLSISSQPFVYYQEASIRNIFEKLGLNKQGFTVEGAGFLKEEFNFDKNIASLLDNLARTINTEMQLAS